MHNDTRHNGSVVLPNVTMASIINMPFLLGVIILNVVAPNDQRCYS
jgi:hypothetical protein